MFQSLIEFNSKGKIQNRKLKKRRKIIFVVVVVNIIIIISFNKFEKQIILLLLLNKNHKSNLKKIKNYKKLNLYKFNIIINIIIFIIIIKRVRPK